DFVLEGPPGTGKSQTIANIIAHNLGLGRRVLFVSVKMTALEVVYRRLVEKCSGRFYLELHSSKTNIKDELGQLDRFWRERGEEKLAALEVVYRRLVEKGLGRLCLELHSSKANKKDVLGQLDRSWSERGEETAEHWQAEAARLKELRDSLNGLVKALHTPGRT